MKFITVPGNEAIERAISSIGQKTRFIVCGDPAAEAWFLTTS
ncbi:hypothetical protein [cf. Phormidesmis sp. LEGE 11477]|nr:hypothetical protein [cf. Phormidesmis sp. LEGE 11477]